jgi:hypothetical protein
MGRAVEAGSCRKPVEAGAPRKPDGEKNAIIAWGVGCTANACVCECVCQSVCVRVVGWGVRLCDVRCIRAL